MKKIIVDTDVGNDIDDVFALSYLFARKDAEILGAPTVWGETQFRSECVDVIARAAKKQFPIFRGAVYSYDNSKCGKVYDSYKALATNNPHSVDFGGGTDDAVEFLYKTIKENPDEVTLIAIGPLTNVALLFERHPDAAELLEELVVMGGAYFENPRCTWDISVEWNFKCDPYAAKIVFDANVPKIRVFGVDLTWDYQLPRLTAAGLLSADWCAPQRRYAEQVYRGDPIWFHDPIACALTFENSMGEFQRGDIKIEIKNENMLGKSIFTPNEFGRCLVCMALSVDSDSFYKHYTDVLHSL